MKSKLIAVSAVSAGFSAIFLTFGAYFEFFDLVGVVFASIFAVLPIYFNSYKGCFLSYLSGGVIAFIFSGFNIFSIVFPIYFLFFGLYPPIKYIAYDKNFNKTLFTVLTLVWCIIAAVGSYYYYILIIGEELFVGLPQFIVDYAILFVILVAILFYFVFDRFVRVARILIQRNLGRFIK